jgi:hypothetical protein
MNNTKQGCLVKLGKIAGLLAIAVIMLTVVYSQYRQHARRAWKEGAIPEIARDADDPLWVSNQVALLRSSPPGDRHIIAGPWLSDRMILMKTGEWLVYRSHCSKASPHQVSDIFLAKNSEGKWYYSTLHFCVGMIALVMIQETQPNTLSEFVKEYNLREFDGCSDECLKATASAPASWGQDRKAKRGSAAQTSRPQSFGPAWPDEWTNVVFTDEVHVIFERTDTFERPYEDTCQRLQSPDMTLLDDRQRLVK